MNETHKYYNTRNRPVSDPLIGQVLLGPGHPKDAAPVQVPQMSKVHITLVKQGDFTAFQIGAQFARPQVVMLGGGVHDDEPGQQALQVQAKMCFGGGFAPAMFRPVHAVGDQLHRRAVDDMNRHLKRKAGPRLLPAAKPGD